MSLGRAVEEAGIPTVIVASLPSVCRQAGAPRVLAVDTPMGAALGAPGDGAQHARIVRAALALLARDDLAPGHVEPSAERYRTG